MVLSKITGYGRQTIEAIKARLFDHDSALAEIEDVIGSIPPSYMTQDASETFELELSETGETEAQFCIHAGDANDIYLDLSTGTTNPWEYGQTYHVNIWGESRYEIGSGGDSGYPILHISADKTLNVIICGNENLLPQYYEGASNPQIVSVTPISENHGGLGDIVIDLSLSYDPSDPTTFTQAISAYTNGESLSIERIVTHADAQNASKKTKKKGSK